MYDVYIVTNTTFDTEFIMDQVSIPFYITPYYNYSKEGKKKGFALLNEFGARELPFICVKLKGKVVKCFYSEESDDVLNDFVNWIYFNDMENSELIPQIENYLQQPLTIKVKNEGTCKLPSYADNRSSGADLRANLKEAVTIEPGTWKLILTGLHMQIPKGFEIQIRPRSGLALKNGITILNAPGTVDSSYTGDVGCIVFNASDKPYTIYPADRVAQAVLCRVYKANYEEVDEIEETERGSGGYGHSGIK